MIAFNDAGNLREAALGREVSLRALSERERKVRRDFWKKLKRFAARVPFVDDIVAAYYCALDPATPIRVRGMLLASLAYFIMPADAVPDIVVGLGFTDDAAVIAGVIGLLSQHIKPRHRAAALQALGRDLQTGGAQPENADRAQ